MLIRTPQAYDCTESEVTPRSVFENRRRFLLAAGLGLGGAVALKPGTGRAAAPAPTLSYQPSQYSTQDKMTAWKDVTTYNNFYEFGTSKSAPAEHAHHLKPRPWTVQIDGEVNRPGPIDIEDLLKLAPLEERIYRMRCVEGWSMVIPWVGVPLSALIKKVEPTSHARFVEFVTLDDPQQMPGLSYPVINWPYTEGLRMDEANHPLTLLAMGLYGNLLPNQNGAPVRMVIPWKYGFKSGKSIVRIRFTRHQPKTSWNLLAPHEYGFYANVNPEVDHPRWSQATERRIGEDGFFAPKRKTLMSNGYAEQVASLYAGMDLRRQF